jgi:pyrophosphate--fructose-6-phosphate 1-phosphotransferase
MAPASIVSNGNVTPTVTTRFASVYSEVQNSRVDHKLRLPSVLQSPFAIVDGPKSSAAGNPGFYSLDLHSLRSVLDLVFYSL